MKKKLKKLLMQNDMKLKDLASSLGITRQHFYNKMVANSFTPDQLEIIATFLKVPVSYLTSDTDETKIETSAGDLSVSDVNYLKEKIEDLERIIREKERSIMVMESMIEYLKKKQDE